jgi:hypothetical protein
MVLLMVLKVAGKSWKTCQWETMDNHCIIGDLLGTIVLEAGKRWEQHLGYTNPLDVGDFCCGTGSYQHGDKSLCDPFLWGYYDQFGPEHGCWSNLLYYVLDTQHQVLL